jgi:hypothetical protein
MSWHTRPTRIRRTILELLGPDHIVTCSTQVRRQAREHGATFTERSIRGGIAPVWSVAGRAGWGQTLPADRAGIAKSTGASELWRSRQIQVAPDGTLIIPRSISRSTRGSVIRIARGLRVPRSRA